MSDTFIHELRAVLWTGGDAPNLDAKLTVSGDNGHWMAFWEPGYCGCPDCHCLVGVGDTPGQAEFDYWKEWREKYVIEFP
jgi:hypothetical protein